MDTVTGTEIKESAMPAPKKAKAKNSKPKKAKAKNGAPKKAKAGSKSDQGQGGPALELGIAKMNKSEQKLIKGIWTKSGERKPHTIKELQSFIGGKSTSPARNALRRLVRAGWVEKTVLATADKKKKRGVYRLTEKARKRDIKN